ncbi:sigma-54-dependent Fis family transcriptional regulator [Azoarcus sp. KH32C]|uniref:sigma-54-dependent Fis family transcriptional regulator n=1 Tax=Azoarcus sp. KH32C TaxID=748247 RepID=UPI0002386FCC|nr:sigma-54-dependent Fis family transcriptional regulator [Azoarcus sp. KH32C]BAL23935.1 GAF modulated sigma-54 specific transcriptional regulator, Fis family [Azoarcus sp. KH32C]
MVVIPQLRERRDDAVLDARRSFFEQGETPESGVAPLVLRSWERSRSAGLDVQDGRLIDPVGRARLSEARERSARLLDQAGGIMEHVFEQIRSTGSMVILADIQGMILHCLGDPDFVGRAHQVALQPGASWEESVRGTNAIGTAIVERGAVEVLGAEHYLERNGFLTCCAVPVFSASGQLAGVFDISGDSRSHQRHTLGLARLSVQLLEKRLFEAEFARDIRIAFHPRPEYVGSLQEGMIAISPEGAIIGANPFAREYLGLTPGLLETPALSTFLRIGFGQLMDRAASAAGDLLMIETRRAEPVYVQVRGQRPVRVEVSPTKTLERAPERAAAKANERGRNRIQLDDLATGDVRLQLALDRARRVLGKDIPLLIQGESGVGKELFASAFHHSGPRCDGPFVALNCAAIPENLIESELFGYVGGAFTGARREGAIGKLQQAHGGTLFLDEIGDMPMGMQARLLRVLQERSVTPIGSMKSIPVDISLVCATHRVLRDAVKQGTFREDLYYRVNSLTVTLPPLRERTDIRHIVTRLLDAEIGDMRRGTVGIGEEVMSFFERYNWPGNVRQLQNVIRVAVALLDDHEEEILPVHLPEELFGTDPCDDGELRRADFVPAPVTAAPAAPVAVQAVAETAAPRSLDEIELAAITTVMREVGGNISAAARRLGVSRNTLYRKLGRMN